MDQATSRKWQLVWRWPLFSLVLISAFWAIWFWVARSIPVQGWKVLDWSFQPISRLWDLLYLPLFVFTLTTSYLNIKFYDQPKDDRSDFIVGSITYPYGISMIVMISPFFFLILGIPIRAGVSYFSLFLAICYLLLTLSTRGINGTIFRMAILSGYFWFFGGIVAGLATILVSLAVWILLLAIEHNCRWSYWPRLGRFLSGARWRKATS